MFVCALIQINTLLVNKLNAVFKQKARNTNKSCASSTASGELHDTISVVKLTRILVFKSTTKDKIIQTPPKRCMLLDLWSVDSAEWREFVFSAKKATGHQNPTP